MKNGPLDNLVKLLGGLPGLGPRSAQRVALHLLTHKDRSMMPLISALEQSARDIVTCHQCGNLDSSNPCKICQNPNRDEGLLCVVASVGDLWAIERTGTYKGRYHILGGVLSALDGIRPEDLRIDSLITRLQEQSITEIILALGATVDGQATGHYLTDRLHDAVPDLKITRVAHGVPVGGELGYLDDGTIATALKSRAAV